jgi:hypothetical protein
MTPDPYPAAEKMVRKKRKTAHELSRWPLRPTTAKSPNANGMFYERAFPLTTKELKAMGPKRQTCFDFGG